MNRVVKSAQGNYVSSDSAADNIQTQRDILDLIVHCSEVGSSRVLIKEGALHPDFFDLSSGLAGDITLKLSSYRVKTAIVADLAKVKSERFLEWTAECNRVKEIFFTASEKKAKEWLLA